MTNNNALLEETPNGRYTGLVKTVSIWISSKKYQLTFSSGSSKSLVKPVPLTSYSKNRQQL